MDYDKETQTPVRRRRRKRKPPYGLYITICILGIALLVLGFAYLAELSRNGRISIPGGGKLFLMGEDRKEVEETDTTEAAEAGFADAYEAYEAFLDQLREEPGGFLNLTGNSVKTEDIRYQYGYVDEDDVPELFLGTGREQEAGVFVYTAAKTADTYEIRKVGEFSQYGILYYIPHENVMISHCGDAGIYYVVYHSIRQGRSSLDRILKQAPGEEDTVYYCGITWEEDFLGDAEAFRGDPKLSGLREDEMRETESEEFFRLQSVYENGHGRQLCAYADMIPLGRRE